MILVDSYQIEGEILTDDDNAINNATIYVRIEDTNRADAPSEIVAEHILRNIKFGSDSGKYVIPFDINIPFVEENRRYTVSVHVDTNGNGKMDKGDYINMESYPVPAKEDKKKVVIKVKQIN
jgi:uncharacterized lipoprotein YbaY